MEEELIEEVVEEFIDKPSFLTYLYLHYRLF